MELEVPGTSWVYSGHTVTAHGICFYFPFYLEAGASDRIGKWDRTGGVHSSVSQSHGIGGMASSESQTEFCFLPYFSREVLVCYNVVHSFAHLPEPDIGVLRWLCDQDQVQIRALVEMKKLFPKVSTIAVSNS